MTKTMWTWILAALTLLALAAAWSYVRGPRGAASPKAGAAAGVKFQCPMHPQIVRDEPGDCPICHMKLEKVAADEDADPAGTAGHAHGGGGDEKRVPFTLSEYRRQLIGVRSAPVEEREILKTLRLPGRVGEDPSAILAQALEMDAGLLHGGLPAEVRLADGEARQALVEAVDNRLDSYSRTFAVTLRLSGAPGRSMRPGVYCDVRVQLRLARGLAVPREAVLDTGDRQVVFVQKEAGRFEPREVLLGKEGDEFVAVRKGLEKGEQVVVSANFLIDSESRFKAAAAQY